MTPPRSFGVFAPVGYLDLAFQGQQEAGQAREALLTGAPSEAETTRVLNVARRFGARLAHKYSRLTVEEILMGSGVSRKVS